MDYKDFSLHRDCKGSEPAKMPAATIAAVITVPDRSVDLKGFIVPLLV